MAEQIERPSVTQGNIAPIKATLTRDNEAFPVADAEDVAIALVSGLGRKTVISPEDYEISMTEEGVIYVDGPATLAAGCYGLEVKGALNGTPWRTYKPSALVVTYPTVAGGGTATATGDRIDITMNVQMYAMSMRTMEGIQQAIDECEAAAGSANDAAQAAENVDAELNGTLLKVTNRQGVSKTVDTKGEKGDAGAGVAQGGSTGQVLVKKSNTDYDTEWKDAPASGVSSVNGKSGAVTLGAEDVGALPDDTPIPAEQIPSDWNQTNSSAKDFIKNKPTNLVEDESYVHTDNNYTDEDKSKLNSALQSETDPTVPQWAKQPNKPSYTSMEVGALPNSTKYGSTIDLTMDSATYVLTLSLKDQDGTVLNTKTVDLPIESVVVNGRYDAANKKIVLTLQSGSTIDVPVGDLIAGLQTEITSVNMLDADLVDDTNSTHKFVTAQEKTAWNNKSDFSGSYNDLTDKPIIPVVPNNVSAFNNDAGYLTQHQDISGKEDRTSIAATSTASGVLNTEAGKYHRIDAAVGTLVIILPAMTDLTTARTVVVYLTAGTTPAVTITSADGKTVVLQDGYEIEAGKTYEINALWNGAAWVIAAVEIEIPTA
jgi:hypothetical protein